MSKRRNSTPSSSGHRGHSERSDIALGDLRRRWLNAQRPLLVRVVLEVMTPSAARLGYGVGRAITTSAVSPHNGEVSTSTTVKPHSSSSSWTKMGRQSA